MNQYAIRALMAAMIYSNYIGADHQTAIEWSVRAADDILNHLQNGRPDEASRNTQNADSARAGVDAEPSAVPNLDWHTTPIGQRATSPDPRVENTVTSRSKRK